MDFNFNNENDPWKFGLDIDDSDLHLTPVLRSSSSTRVEPSLLTPNPVRIIPGHAGKLDQVVAIVKSCSSNVIGDLTVTMIDLSGTIPETIHYKVIGDGGYENDIIVGIVMILANVSFFTHKPSKHYLNITTRNVVKVFRKNSVPESGSG
nr:hypothetical protein [Tanacetum cinerariifolium]